MVKKGYGIFAGYKEKGKDASDPAIIPKRIFRKIKLVLYAEAMRWQLKNGDGNEDASLKNEKVFDRVSNINCHRFVAYILGIVGLQKENDGYWDSNNVRPFFSEGDYKYYQNIRVFKGDIKTILGKEKFGIGQSIDADTGKLIHSFLVGVSMSGKNIFIVDKENIGFAPFRVIELRLLYNQKIYGVDKMLYAIKSLSEAKKVITKDPRNRE